MSTDLIISPAWVATADADDNLFVGHSVVVRDGTIAAIVPSGEVGASYPQAEHVRLPGHLLIPGLVNAHTHAAMTLLRGFADDLPLMEWLSEHIWPAESRWVDKDFVRDGTELAIAEFIKGGTTCFNDMYYYPDVAARVARNAGIRAVLGLIVLDFQTTWGADPDEYFHKGLKLHDELRDQPLLSTALAPHAPYTVSDDPLARIRMYADELDLPVHIHLHESASEIEQAQATNGHRPMQRLARHGLLNPHLVAVHMTQLLDSELAALVDHGANVVHCPESNLKLASGFCPVHELLQAGVNVALGTDGAASNNDLDMLGEMRTAALLAKGVAGDASAVDVSQVLRMATINGARALGIGDVTGSLEVGKSADMVAVSMGTLASQPLYNPLSALVFSANRDAVTDVWVAGKRLLEDNRLTTLDEQALLDRAESWQHRIAVSKP